MAESLSSDNLAAIRAPETEPQAKPDLIATSESQLNTPAKTLKPLEREALAHQAHLETLRSDVEHHKSECDKLKLNHKTDCEVFKQEIDELQDDNSKLRTRIEVLIKELAEESTERRISAKATSLLTVLANSLIVVGGALVAIVGTAPGFSDTQKAAMGYGGSALVVGGLIFNLASFRLTPSSQPKSNQVKPI